MAGLEQHNSIRNNEASDGSQLRLFIQNAPSAVAMFDREMRYLAASKRWMEEYSLGARDIIGLSHYEIFPEILEHWKLIHRRCLAGEVLREDEERFVRADGSVQWLWWEAQPWHTANGEIGGVVIFSEDITERRKTEIALIESNRFFHMLAQISPVGIFRTDAQGGCIYVSERWQEITGMSQDEALGAGWGKAIHPDDREKVTQTWYASAQANKKFLLEYRFQRPDGAICWVQGEAVEELDATGISVGYVGTITDITELKQAELILKQYKVATEITHDGFWIVDETGVLLEANSAYAKMSGYSVDELRGMQISQLEVNEQTREQVNTHIAKITAQGWDVFETRHRHKDGHEIELEVSVSCIPESKQFVTFLRDITERKQIEKSLLRENEKNLAILRNASDGIHILDTNGNVIEASDSFCSMLGYRREEVIGMNASRWDAQLSGTELSSIIRTQLAKKGRSQFETRHRRKDGTIFDVEVSGFPLELDGKPVLFNSSRDITERKVSEATLRFHSNILSNVAEGIFLVNASNGLIVFTNPQFDRMFGYESGELLGKHVSVINAHEDSSPEAVAQYIVKELAQSGVWSGEIHHVRKDGSTFWSSAKVSTFNHPQFGTVWVSAHEDITARKQVEASLKESKKQFELLAINIPVGVYLVHTSQAGGLDFRYVSPRFCSILGVKAEDVYRDPKIPFSPIHPEDIGEFIRLNNVAIQNRSLFFWEGRGLIFGQVRWLHIESIPEAQKNGDYIWNGIISDITERKQAEEAMRISASVFGSSQEAITVTDAENNIVDVNPAFTRITGYSREEVLGKNPKILGSGRQDKSFYAHMWNTLKQDGAWRGEIWNRHKSGKVYAELLSINAICDKDGQVVRYVAVFSDITHIKEHEAELTRTAHYDALTGIPNRVLLADRMKQAISQTSRDKNMLAVCYLDLDGFKPINDTMGHEAGDEVLVEIAKRIGDTVRGGDTVARLGGDEFVILLLGLERGEECVVTLERLLAAIALPIVLKDTSIIISASIGVSIYPQDNEDPDTLLRHADQAMYVAKQSGKNRFHIYDPAMDRRARDQNEFLKSIRHGLENNQFELHYQPKVNLRTQKMVGAEALIRWRHPERGLLTPAEFLNQIANTELDIQIGEWVTATALAQLNQWRTTGLDIEVSINISGYHLESAGFVEKLNQQLLKYPAMPFGKLQIEVLETVALNDISIVGEIIESCRRIGVGFALDDFGTGYSSLSYLSKLPVDVLKIDQSFVRDMMDDKGDMAIVQGIIALARAFDRQIVAEGIETEDHYKILLDMGCELGQGYFMARPMSADELINWKPNFRC